MFFVYRNCSLFSVKFQIQNIEILIFLAFGTILVLLLAFFFKMSSKKILKY